MSQTHAYGYSCIYSYLIYNIYNNTVYTDVFIDSVISL